MTREEMRRRGVELGERLGQPVDARREVVPGWPTSWPRLSMAASGTARI